ncbi:Predicted oxidoreductase [Arenibacter nanhaiticus]|uniref:Predicted oxidoreductase n=1 Tax=Arenibacter nanhaiticus TaxID=558155 RepID=A0A1M6EZF3_9FLAO|nr:aldo/keto reductase [Arenibacter nanhaiticus]SHI90795.1 Predicted oxidoreductase [Arenibacter nanhaiticus]
MKQRIFGRTQWKIGEIGYGMWGMGSWTKSDDLLSANSLDLAVENGVNFFDTAWAYGHGHSESLLGDLLKRYPHKKLYAASKIPAKNFQWPAKPEYRFEDSYPTVHVKEYTEKTLKNLGVEQIDLMQFHTWDDSWSDREEWQRAIEDLRAAGKIAAMGLSVNRWEPENGIKALKTGHFDAVQVIYNIFDQAPEDALFPLCEALDIAIIARVPFDEGTLTGAITKETTFAEGDWRGSYFVPENLISSAEKADLLRPLVPEGMTMAEMALRFITMNTSVSTIIPGMRKQRNVLMNTALSDGKGLPAELYRELKGHRWDRVPTSWSQ